jgi:hypothetical protein
MPSFEVEDDLAELVWRLAKPKPFENLTFGTALRRVLLDANSGAGITESASTPAPVRAMSVPRRANEWQKKAPSPNPAEWAARVSELRGFKNLTTWQAICDVLRIKVAGDSARRKLRNWVKVNRPNWPDVPAIEGDA